MCSTRQRLAALLREQRECRNLTLRQAAIRARLSPSTLSRWESGACLPRVPELEGLLRALGVDPDDVLRILISLDAPRAAKAVRHITEGLDIAPSGGALLRALRRRAGLPLITVAMHLGVATSTVSRWEASALHPGPQILQSLLDLLGASADERACLLASGVAKLRADRPSFDPCHYEQELNQIESRMNYENADAIELRLLQIQTLLWWSLRDLGASQLLRRAHFVYARYLAGAERYGEAITQAEMAMQNSSEGDALTLKAMQIIARSEVYRWPTERPHLGLFTLQRALNLAKDAPLAAGILADLAEYSRLAGRDSEAEGYSQRASDAARSYDLDLDRYVQPA